MSPKLQIYVGEEVGRYGFGDGHPFGPGRLQAFWAETTRRGLDKKVRIASPVLCSEGDITRFHTRRYVQRVKQLSISGTGFLDYGDTPSFKGMFEAASYIVGSDLAGLRQAMDGGIARIFVPIAGLHHARREAAAGFCVFNDVGVLIETMRRKFGIKRIVYVDIDAHHGDGVFYAFEHDPDLIIADIHEDGRFLYPGTGSAEETGKGAAEGTKLNVPLPPGADDASFHRVWPGIEEFIRAGKPEFILLQAGVDSIAGDPITHLAFSPAVHGHVARGLCRIAEEFCNGRIIGMGGGGYSRTNLALGWNQVVKAMSE